MSLPKPAGLLRLRSKQPETLAHRHGHGGRWLVAQAGTLFQQSEETAHEPSKPTIQHAIWTPLPHSNMNFKNDAAL